MSPASVLARLTKAYRATGADLPGGDPLRAHGVGMEGYFWRFTDVPHGRTLIALIGVNQGPRGPWATVGLASSDGFLRTAAVHTGWADPDSVGAAAGPVFAGDGRTVRVDLGPDARLDLVLQDTLGWPYRLFGGSSGFQLVPGLNQYWHPWLLGGRASGTATLGDRTWHLADAQVYAEKNWGREGFPEAWWWGQAQGFGEPGACLAFAGGMVRAGPLHTTVTALVVRLPDGRVLRLGNPGTSPVRAQVGAGSWLLSGRASLRGWQIEVEGHATQDRAHVLPIPLPREERNVPGDLEVLPGQVWVRVLHRGREVWAGESSLAGLEEGGRELADREMQRRGAAPGSTGAGPLAADGGGG